MTNPVMVRADVVAKILGVSVKTVYNLGDKDALPFPMHKFGRNKRFKRIDVEAFTGEPLVLDESEGE